MALRKRPIAAGIASLLLSGYVSALGLGEIKLNSALNEPLDAEIPLQNMGELTEDEIIAGLASNADFADAGVDKELILTTLVFTLDMNAPGGPTLRLASKKPIREPYLDFLVDVQWPSGRLLREYTLLLDLPVYAGGGTSKKKIEQPAVQQRPGSTGQTPPASAGRPRLDVAAGDQEYLVHRGDTLWSIASRLESDASIHQRMDAILQINPDAFIDGDINLLKSGAVLRLPDYGAMHSQLSGRGSYAADESAYSPELSASTRQEQYSPPADSGGRLTLEAGGEGDGRGSSVGSGSGSMSGIRGDVSVLQEELDKSQRENSELKQRLSSLEDQITTMQRLMDVSDDDLRAIQLSQMAGDLPEGEGELSTGTAIADDFAEERVSEDMEVDSPALALFPSANTSPAKKPSPAKNGGDTAGAVGAVANGGPDSPANGQNEVAETSDSSSGSKTVQPVTESEQKENSAPAPMKMDLKTEKGWFENVNGFLTVLLGLVVVLIGAIAVFVLRKRKETEDDYQPPAQTYTPPPAPVRERPREVPPEPQAKTIDDIDLKEEDDLFAQPEQESGAGVAPVVAEPAPAREPESLEDMELDLSEFDLDETTETRDDVVFDESGAEPVASAEELNLDEEFDFLGDIDEGDTQLELAQAYIEMGDQAGAKEILQEVADGGSDEQKEKARRLLEQLG